VNLQVAIAEAGAAVKAPAELPEVTADPIQLTQLFQNLVPNAVKFRRPEQVPCIAIDAEQRGAMWRFTVRDNGIGIEPGYAARIFQIFQRLDPGKYPGDGIGLALAKRIVDRHGGQIGVEPSPDGTGSQFSFTLPAAAE